MPASFSETCFILLLCTPWELSSMNTVFCYWLWPTEQSQVDHIKPLIAMWNHRCYTTKSVRGLTKPITDSIECFKPRSLEIKASGLWLESHQFTSWTELRRKINRSFQSLSNRDILFPNGLMEQVHSKTVFTLESSQVVLTENVELPQILLWYNWLMK